jgi:hypothetical protein
MAITSANQLELLQTAEAVAREKMIDPSLVIEAMEESLARAAKSRYGAEIDIHVAIDRKTGRAAFTRVRTVVDAEEMENDKAEFTTETAKPYFAAAAPGRDEYWLRDGPDRSDRDRAADRRQLPREVPPVDMGRIAAQSAKQVILQKVREAERDASTRNSRTAPAPSSTAGQARGIRQRHRRYRPGRGRPAPQRQDRPRELSQRRPHPLLHQGRAPRDARAADLPVAHRAGIHGRAVQDGSAGDLRRHHRDQGRGPRPRFAARRSP